MPADHGITWVASYPKSGNTWLRCLLEAYRCNGVLDINDLRFVNGDASAAVIQSVSPIPLQPLGLEGELLLRPAGLLNLKAATHDPCFVKTHFCNMTWEGCAPSIPEQFTTKAIYVVRDPRCVLPSFAKYYCNSLSKAADQMNDKKQVIGGDRHARVWINSWSNHVASWIAETRYPLHVVKYEDMYIDAGHELREVLEFLEWDIDEDRIKRSVEATEISRLKKVEQDKGFRENPYSERGAFFNGAGVDWREEIGLRWADRIEQDHGKVMSNLGYIDAESTNLAVVNSDVSRSQS